MNELIEDILTANEIQSIADVLSSNAIRFDRLVEIAGLDRTEDFQHCDLRQLNFCGADLRGFDFTGSDLRGSVRDERTVIDSTTILTDTKVEWVDERDIPIVQLMQEVQAATSSTGRRQALETLEKRFGKTEHVTAFVVNDAASVRSIDAFLDFVDFLPDDLPDHHLNKIIDAGVRVLSGKFRKSRSRTKRETTTIFAASTIMERLSKTEASLAADWFASLANILDRDETNDALSGTTTGLTQQHIVSALEALRP